MPLGRVYNQGGSYGCPPLLFLGQRLDLKPIFRRNPAAACFIIGNFLPVEADFNGKRLLS